MSEEQQEAISETSSTSNTFTSDGEVGALIRSLDWSQTPLGAAENWSESLKSIVQIISTELDQVKEQKQQEQRSAAVTQQHEIESLLSKINNGFYRLDRQWRFTFANDRLCEILSMKRELLIGRSIWELFPDAINTQFDIELHRALNEQTPVLFENFYQPWNRWYEHWVYPSSEGLVIFAADITDRRQVEEQLRQSSDRFNTAMRAVDGIVFEWNLLAQTVYRSERLFQLLGVRAEDAPPTSEWWFERIHPDDVQDLAVKLPEIMANGDRYECEYRVRHKAGHWVDVWERGYLQRNAQGEIIKVVGFTTDVSDRRRTEAALRLSEERYRLLTSTLTSIVWSATPEGALITPQPEWEAYTGQSWENYRNWGWVEALHPEDRGQVVALWSQGTEKRTIISCYEGRMWHAVSGEYHYFEAKGLPLLNPDGSIREWIGTITDIHDRKQSEAALRESESQFRLMVESAKEYAIFTMDLQGDITKWNSGAERLLGYTEAEAIGCQGRIIFTPEDNAHGRAEFERQTALAQGKAANERWHVRKDGSRFWASGLMMPLLNETGILQGVVKILQDKTAQRQAGERLQLLHETTRDLLSTDQPLALIHNLFAKLSVQLDLHCYYNFMVEEKGDRALLHLVNYEGISEEVAQKLEWIDFGEYLCGLAAQEQHQVVFNKAQLKAHPNAQAIYAMGVRAYAGQPLIAQGRLLGTLSFGSQTRTHFTPAEAELLQSTCDQIAIAIERTNLTHSLQQQAEELRQANRIKDEFLAVLSHELRSPLNPILGWSKLLQSGKLDPPKTVHALATIERNAKLQSELIEDLLDVSRILQGKLRLNASSVDLSAVIEAAIETVQLAAEAKSIAIETTLDPNVGQVSGDVTRLQQVIWNLLSNAVKFTPMGGRVTVQLEKLENQAQITISDTGKGILPSFVPHVFDYFRQEDGATTRKFGGLGLGLAIVRHLVELHGGTVQVASLGEDLGATFTVKLPLIVAPAAGTANPLSSELSLGLKGIRVLVIDDETDSREFVAFVLEQAGASVTTAPTAAEGFALLTQSQLTQSQPDVLLSDIGMPDMDGYMLMRQVRRLPSQQGGNVLAIALTAYAGDFNQQQALQAGFQQHLAKPIEPETLLKAIANLTQRVNQNPR